MTRLRAALGAICACGFLAACAAPVPDVSARRDVATADLPPMKRFAPTPPAVVTRPNAEIARDFLELTFEMESGRKLDTFSRFEGPVRVALAGDVPAAAAGEVSRLIGMLRDGARIDIAPATPGTQAQVTIEFLPRARLQALVPQAACFVAPRVSSWAEYRAARFSATVDWTTLQTRDRIAIFIPSDVAPQEVRDCLHEELAQALGPLNDLYRLSDSVFNDDNFHTVLTAFDLLILRVTYAPELRSGMTQAEVAARLPGILARINPRGGAGGVAAPIVTPRAWIEAIEQALGPRTASEARRVAARRALDIATQAGWQDARRAFSHFAVARLSLAAEIETAVLNFAAASRIYATLPGGRIHLAHIDMQMAAFALSSGQGTEALVLTERALPAVTEAQNAALLSTLLMIRAEALDLAGRGTEARNVRRDSLAWGRYGMGADAFVLSRLAEIAALTPRAATRVTLTGRAGLGALGG